MGFFDKLFGKEKEKKRQELMAKLDEVDFIEAAKNIEFTFETGRKQAQEKGGDLLIKKEMLSAVNYYMEKPCLERAIILIEQYPSFLPMFELTKDPLQKWAKEIKEKHQ
jgi:hypothetical protein